MNEFGFNSASIRVTFFKGVGEDGKPVLKNATYNYVKEGATRTEVLQFVQAIASLSVDTIHEVFKTNKLDVL